MTGLTTIALPTIPIAGVPPPAFLAEGAVPAVSHQPPEVMKIG
jgi:hypothetical protein